MEASYSLLSSVPEPRDPTAARDLTTLTEPRLYSHIVFHNEAWYVMAAIAGVLLSLCALLAGLTLALCGLDEKTLHLRSITGPPKQSQQARVVARIKRRSTWMLCSLIICSVACGEALPLVIQSLWHGDQQWVPILISTVLIALFAEILPQYLIPRHALVWGYYCYPLIWGCMGLTAILSYPLSCILDTVSGRKDEYALFNNDELAAVVKYNEKSEQHGGFLSQDASRIMLGALSLDSQSIGCYISTGQESDVQDGKDLEKSGPAHNNRVVVPWPSVKTISIDDPIDEAFIQKIRGWTQSRILVTGNPRYPEREVPGEPREGICIWGFLHTKNLIGFDFKCRRDSDQRIVVRDLPLDPVPIVHQDMSTYDVLNMFQLGMSRIAIVLPNPLEIEQASSSEFSRKLVLSRTPCWTATERTNSRILQRAKESSLAVDWPLYVGQAAKANFGDFDLSGRDVVGIRCPMPVGIVTFKTIIDSLLQKTGCDERGFFDRQIGRSSNSPSDYAKNSDDASITLNNTSNSHHQSKGTTMRRRKVSNKEIFAVDGAGDFSDASTEVQCTRFRRRSSQISGSSYTKNSQGGFHVAEMFNSAGPKLNNAMAATSEELADFRLFTDYFSLSDPSCNLPNGIAGLLSSTSGAPILPSGLSQMCRHNSVTPALPRLQRVTPFSNQSYSNYENLAKETVKEHQIKVPAPTFPCQFHPQHNITGPISNIIAETDLSGIPQAATDHADEGKDEFILKNLHRLDGEANVDVRQAHEGFPLQFPESNHSGHENRLFPYASRTLPRMVGLTVDTTVRTDGSGYQTPVREESFQDDRALLPSQRRIMNSSATMSFGIGRSSSLWF